MRLAGTVSTPAGTPRSYDAFDAPFPIHSYVKGTFTVKEDLPAHLQHGLFAKPGSAFPVIARYANEPSHLKPDTDSMPRGLSMKLFDVPEGNRIDTESYGDSSTQDILMNNADMLELTDLDTTLEIFTLRERHWREPEKLKAELAKRSDRTKQFAPGMLPSKPILGMTMFSQCESILAILSTFGPRLTVSPAHSQLPSATVPTSLISPSYQRATSKKRWPTARSTRPPTRTRCCATTSAPSTQSSLQSTSSERSSYQISTTSLSRTRQHRGTSSCLRGRTSQWSISQSRRRSAMPGEYGGTTRLRSAHSMVWRSTNRWAA